ncbi:MAG: formylmethanofuran--tetrahydromethanopterin N-formyltransferase [Gammaproteobacteria bacterium]|nr:formylmethanofuran--tetrahydromethanopterin N-formyltransferase [Gammaproteobacteria bacterium]
MPATIDDTYAEAFKSTYVEILITANNRTWLDHAIHAATGNASSTILCDCEAGLDRYVGPGGDEGYPTPDGRPGAVIQLHAPVFWKDRVERLERAALVRISQNILTCPTAACFNLIDSDDYFHIGRKVAYFGNGYQKRIERYGRKLWWIPILGGEFVLDRRLGYRDGLMGGNLWYFGSSVDTALEAAERGAEAAARTEGVILPFPGGLAGSGSKAGSKYDFTIASTYEKFCPQLRDDPSVETGLPEGVESVMEIIMNGRDMASIIAATQAAIQASRDTPGLVMISAGNYGGRLGKSLIYLHPERQSVA